ncbi:hypothetical protein HZB02_07720 [Candidatus Woesearchaeota archaeon]|nr:hypothetical protein [Candidatus Woesearchaeota archaeon]
MEMTDNTLLQLSMILCIIGIALIIIISALVPLPEKMIQLADDQEMVRLHGVILDVKHTTGTTQLTVQHACVSEAVAFDQLEVQQGDTVEVTGRVSNNRGKKEVLIDQMKIVERS